MSRLNSRLMDGWSPFFESEDARLYMPLCKVVETYLAEKERAAQRLYALLHLHYRYIPFVGGGGLSERGLFLVQQGKGGAVHGLHL